MGSTRRIIALKDFTDKHGRPHKKGDRIEVDPEYGQEVIRRGEAQEDSSAEQLPADPTAKPK